MLNAYIIGNNMYAWAGTEQNNNYYVIVIARYCIYIAEILCKVNLSSHSVDA